MHFGAVPWNPPRRLRVSSCITAPRVLSEAQKVAVALRIAERFCPWTKCHPRETCSGRNDAQDHRHDHPTPANGPPARVRACTGRGFSSLHKLGGGRRLVVAGDRACSHGTDRRLRHGDALEHEDCRKCVRRPREQDPALSGESSPLTTKNGLHCNQA
ncbi:hypothetical protein AOX55_00005896 (plasmid) [Sinorhizobium fredii CCBAU 25509]|nr:hypothetical protein AOX55_00005896 [Sinorhizobium fredii CCBAU 25509]